MSMSSGAGSKLRTMFCELGRAKRGGADQERESVYERSEINNRDSGSSPFVRNACFMVVAICSLGAGSKDCSGVPFRAGTIRVGQCLLNMFV